jgi:glycogen operon protein
VGPIGARGGPVSDDTFFVLFNAHYDPLSFTVPAGEWGRRWAVVVDTRQEALAEASGSAAVQAGQTLALEGRSLVLLRRVD